MASCPNINLESWKNLVATKGEPMAYYLWDKYNGNVPASESLVSSEASPKTIAMIKDFIKRIGVDIESVKDIVVNGKRMTANGAALVTQKLIQVVQGAENQALTEEAMHFAVEIIKQKNPKLYQKLLKEINNYNIYKDVLAQYGTDPNWQKNGKPDIIKLKEEAIAKVLTETIIKREEGYTEKPELLAKTQSLWQDILDFIKKLFNTSGFDQAAMDIISGKSIGTADDIRAEEGKFFLQKTGDPQLDVWNALKAIHNRMSPDKENGGYFFDDKKVLNRVSDLVQDFYTLRFNALELTNDEYDNAKLDVMSTTGTGFHADMEHLVKNVFTDENGLLREVEGDDADYVSELDPKRRDAYEILKQNLRDRLHSFGPGTRFLAETMVYNPKFGKKDLGGTIDLIAIKKDGKISLLDWKFINLNTEKYTDIPWYKVAAWNLQMENYKNILVNAYGFDPKNFEQTRMIPVKVHYTPGDKKNNILPKMDRIEIGAVNVQEITDDYLIPVGLTTEPTRYRKVNELLKKLHKDYDVLSSKKVTDYKDKADKTEQLNALYSAIRKLHMQGDLGPLLEQAKVMMSYIRKTIDEFNNDWVGTDPESYTDQQLSDFSIKIQNHESSLETYLTLDVALRDLFPAEMTPDMKALRDEIREVVDEARYLKEDLNHIAEEYARDFNAAREGIEDVDKADKVQKGLSRLFLSTPLIQNRGIQAFFLKSNRALTKAVQDTFEEGEKLQNIKSAYDVWASGKGLNAKNYFDIIKKKGKNELIDEFNPDFYKQLKDAIADKDFDWIKANVDEDKIKELVEERIKLEDERTDSRPNLTDYEKELAKKQHRRLYSIDNATSPGWLQYSIMKQAPLRANWESEEFKKLQSPENAPAKDFYDYIVERNNYYKSIGYLSREGAARTFLPYVRKGAFEKLIGDGKVTLLNDFLESISLDSEKAGFGQYDARTGEPINTIPKYFTGKLEEGDYSNQLFYTMALYNQMAIKFKYLSEIEGQALGLLALERNKQAINTSWFGNVKKDAQGNLEYINDNSKNAQLFENMINALLYGQKYVSGENFDFVIAKMGDFGEKINKKLGMKIFPELAGKDISFNRAVAGINRYFQLKTLGLSILAPMSNLLGGNFQSLINSGKYMTKTDHYTAQAFLLSKMAGASSEEVKKFMGMLDYFLPLTENYGRDIAKKLNGSKFNEDSVQDFLMFLMRNSEKNVQTVNFRAFMKNVIVEDGKLYNVREYLRATPEYENMYLGTEKERAARVEKFEEDVKKLINEKGIFKVATLDENNKLVIPGVERQSDNVIKMRTLIQQINADALGSLPESQKRMLNLTIYGDSAAMFKNWVPRLVDVRFGDLKYNVASEAWEYGRMRTFVRELSSRHFYSLSNLKAILNGTVTDQGINKMREEFEKTKEKYEKETGRKLKMTESEFMDMYRNNVRNALTDTIATLTMLAMFFALKAEAPDEDEDVRVKNTYKFMLRAADKFTDELFYFYDPRNINKLISSSVFPSIKLITDFQTLLANFLKYNYGIVTGADEGELENIHFVKYLMKTFPGSNQIEQYLPMAAPEVAKELGIRAQSTSGFFR